MANNTIAQRFTENVYATKQEVKHELHTPLVDTFWKNIIAYRNEFAQPLGVYDIDRAPFTFCLCNSIEEKIKGIERKLYVLSDRFNEIPANSHERTIFKRDAMVGVLKEIAKVNNLNVDDKYLSMIYDGNVSVDDDNFSKIDNYLRVINSIPKLLESTIDEDILSVLYAKLGSSNELISLYRLSDTVSHSNKNVNDRINEITPANLIPGMMSDLLEVINNDELSIVVKTALTYYFVAQIKPFAEFNEEMAMIMAKLVLAKNDGSDIVVGLDLEKLFTDLLDKEEKTFVEVQRNHDLTYFLDDFMLVLDEQIDKQLTAINKLEATVLKDDYYRDDLKEANLINQEDEPEIEEKIENEIQPESIVKETIPTPKKVETKEVIKEVIVEKEPIIRQKEYVGLAISSLPTVLDEKEAARLEEDLLESDPELKRSQAYFYARHCTMGKRYTINQFKKELGCAYETARTSMDSLASLGYYRQEMVKNKKVYTPIKKD